MTVGRNCRRRFLRCARESDGAFSAQKSIAVGPPLRFHWKPDSVFPTVWEKWDGFLVWKKPVEYGREKYINIGNKKS
jgi:hypothetical protein